MRFVIRKHRRLQTQGQPSSQILLSLQQNQIDLLFDKLIHQPWGAACWQPFADVFESPTSYTIELDLPGINPNSVTVRISHGKVIIEGNRDIAEPPESRLCCSERPQGLFQRTIDVIQPVKTEIKKYYEQGVLTVILQKQTNESGEFI